MTKIEFDAKISSESSKHLVVNGHCSLINQFSLSVNFSFDCNWKYLPIDFVLKHHSGEEKILTAYMDSHTNELLNHQELSETCVKIRRFKIDSKFEIIIVKNSIKLVESKDV